ncbi:MAG: LysM peptidoglycan-binding domain-containing protein [Bacteroidia bacterium]|nr:LysM peptidoglycan-binding domain-containing protein [Bacteroidia bacterium]
MSVVKLTIKAFKDNTYQAAASAGTFTAAINPDKWAENFSVQLSNKKALGGGGQEKDFVSYLARDLSLTFFFDATGLVSTIPDAEKGKTVKEQIAKLKEVVYNMNSDTHQPNYVSIIWGNNKFRGRLKSMNVEYTLMNSKGRPLRARVTCSFTDAEDLKTAQKANKPSSPDMTHTRQVKAGNTLPLLCQEIYQDPKYYIEVARKNDLNQFRKLPPGISLKFPPLEK